MRPINADALEEHKFVGNEFVRTDYQQGWNDAIDAIIDNAPTIEERQGEWIPVSEKLPEFGKTVLCQCQAKIYEVLKYTSCGWYHDDAHCYMEGFVIAWMDLPESYTRGEV